MFGGSTQHLPKCEAYFCKFLCFWANFDCCKWPNFEKLACPSGNTNALVNLTKMRFSGPTFSTQTAVVEVDLAKRTGFGPVMGNFNRTIHNVLLLVSKREKEAGMVHYKSILQAWHLWEVFLVDLHNQIILQKRF